jgi:succinate dehydrogenase / fumarate reductase, cytochrome b subunit
MSKTTATRPRPLSPHLTAYRWPATMLASILHRITGGALYFGALLLAWWLIAVATSEDHFNFVDGIIGSWFGLLVLFGFTLALALHLLGGVRHLIWDTGHGLEKHNSILLAWATFAGALVLTVAIWLGYFLIGGVGQ